VEQYQWAIVFLFTFFGFFTMMLWYWEYREHCSTIDNYNRRLRYYSEENKYLSRTKLHIADACDNQRKINKQLLVYKEQYHIVMDALEELRKEKPELDDILTSFLQLVRLSKNWELWSEKNRKAFLDRYSEPIKPPSTGLEIKGDLKGLVRYT
jgi:hypothetical protein